jgi:hypothetical protein
MKFTAEKAHAVTLRLRALAREAEGGSFANRHAEEWLADRIAKFIVACDEKEFAELRAYLLNPFAE